MANLESSVIIEIPVEGKVLHQVRFYSDHSDPRPVVAHYPWPYPWWFTGTYTKKGWDENQIDGCTIVAIVEDMEKLKKAWPEGRDFEILEKNISGYVFTDRFQPGEDELKMFGISIPYFDKIPSASAWPVIVKAFKEAEIGKIVYSGQPPAVVVEPQQYTADDFYIWWLNQDATKVVSDHLDIPRGWPEYLVSEVRSREGRNGKAQLWVNPIHMKMFPNLPKDLDYGPYEDCGGIVFLAKHIHLLKNLPGVITNRRLGVIQSNVYMRF